MYSRLFLESILYSVSVINETPTIIPVSISIRQITGSETILALDNNTMYIALSMWVVLRSHAVRMCEREFF